MGRAPERTDAQRAEALAKAVRVRSARAEMRRQVREGGLGVADVLAASDAGAVAARGMRVRDLVGSHPGYGPARTAALMARLGIPANRRVGGLGPRQRAALADALGGL